MPNLSPLIWIGIAVTAVVAIAVVVNVTIFVDSEPEAVSTPATGTETANERQARRDACDLIQKKIDAAGRPGWDGLSPALQAEIEAHKTQCTFIGDGQQF